MCLQKFVGGLFWYAFYKWFTLTHYFVMCSLNVIVYFGIPFSVWVPNVYFLLYFIAPY